MPMTAEGLAAARKAARPAPSQSSDPVAAAAAADEYLLADCQAIVDYIKANAVVNVTSVSGVTPGSGVSSTGSGTIA